MNNSTPSLDELLRWRANNQPSQLAYQFLDDGNTPIFESISSRLNYAQLDGEVSRIAVQISKLVEFEDELGPARVLLAFPPGLEFVTSFLACIRAGVIAVPVPPPSRRDQERFKTIVKDAQPQCVLTKLNFDNNVKNALERIEKIKLPQVAVTSLGSESGEELKENSLSEKSHLNNTAFIQYTSGSTGSPKGVIVTHSNLINNLEKIQQIFSHDENSCGVIWLPPYHDMGLIGGILQPLFVGFPVTLMPPTSFLRNPLRWLQAIDQLQATTSGGPDFAYRHCMDRIHSSDRKKLDLSSWRVAFTGSEVVRSRTLSEFSQAFAESGFQSRAWLPCYGLAESTLLAAGVKVEKPAKILQLDKQALVNSRVVKQDSSDIESITKVASGQIASEHQVLIVNPNTFEPVSNDEIGEIWLTGPSIAKGYWKQPEATTAVFAAYTQDGRGPYLRTGDLGFLSDDELIVSGRLKEMIILRGRNYFPVDIERCIEEVDVSLGSNTTAAFMVDDSEEEKLIVVQEVHRHFSGNAAESLFASIRAALSERFELTPHEIVIVKFGRLAKTSSGKIQRLRCREQYVSNQLESLANWQMTSPSSIKTSVVPKPAELTTSTIRIWLQTWLAKRIGCSRKEIEFDRPLVELGLDSLAAVDLAAAISELVGQEQSFSETMAWRYPTINALAEHICGFENDTNVSVDVNDLDAAELLLKELNLARERRM